MKLPKQTQPVVRDASVTERIEKSTDKSIYPSYSECWDKPTTAGVIGCAAEAVWDWIVK